MDRLKKSLLKLSAKERKVAEVIITRIVARDIQGLNIKKLKGFDNVFRVRKGELRVIYVIESGVAIIIDVTRRNDTTYNF